MKALHGRNTTPRLGRLASLVVHPSRAVRRYIPNSFSHSKYQIQYMRQKKHNGDITPLSRGTEGLPYLCLSSPALPYPGNVRDLSSPHTTTKQTSFTAKACTHLKGAGVSYSFITRVENITNNACHGLFRCLRPKEIVCAPAAWTATSSSSLCWTHPRGCSHPPVGISSQSRVQVSR